MKKTCITHNLLTGEAIKIKLTSNKFFRHSDDVLYMKAALILLTLCQEKNLDSQNKCDTYKSLNDDLKDIIKQLV